MQIAQISCAAITAQINILLPYRLAYLWLFSYCPFLMLTSEQEYSSLGKTFHGLLSWCRLLTRTVYICEWPLKLCICGWIVIFQLIYLFCSYFFSFFLLFSVFFSPLLTLDWFNLISMSYDMIIYICVYMYIYIYWHCPRFNSLQNL